MIKAIVVSVFLFLVSVENATAQQKLEKEKYIEVPNTYGTIFIMNQPESPLGFEEVQFLIENDNQLPKIRFIVRNKTTKKIFSFSVAFRRKSDIREWIPYGVGWEHTVGKKEAGIEIISPNGTYENIKRKNFELIPISERTVNLFRSKDGEPQAKIVWIGIVKRVVFEDGSVFDTGNLIDELANFMFDEK